jgi:hypothetical protein
MNKNRSMQEKIDGHSVRLASDTDLIIEIQNEMRKLYELIKVKASGEELESMNNLIEDMWDKMNEHDQKP